MRNTAAFIDQLATRYPETAIEIVKITETVRNVYTNTGEIDLVAYDPIERFASLTAKAIADDVAPDALSLKHRLMVARVRHGILNYAYPEDLRSLTILAERRHAAEHSHAAG